MKRTFAVLLCLAAVASTVWAAESTVLIRVERKTSDDLALLRAADLPVVMELSPCLLVEGDSKHVEWLRAHGYAAQVIDVDAEQWQYFVIGLRPDSDRAAVGAFGVVLLSEENWVLVRAPREASIEAIAAARVFVTRMPRTPLAAPKTRDLAPAPAGPGGPVGAAIPLVQQMVDSVSAAEIDKFWIDLTSNPPTGTRYSTSQGCRDAATYCYSKYSSHHVPAQYQNWSTSHAPNVIGTHEGAINPGNVYIVIGHLDDLPSYGLAPGADDNASGTVNLLESARVMSCYAFRNTVKFIACTGEESGLLGSEAYADDAAARGENVLGVINMDMISWQGDGSPNPENLDLNYNSASEDLGLRFKNAASTYGTGLVVDAFLCPSLSASDHYPFWTHGWDAVCGITDNEGYCGHGGNYPYYHTSNDTIANNGDKSFFYSVIRTSVATLAELADPFKIAFDRTSYACDGSAIEVHLGDRDLNLNPAQVETVTVSLSSNTETTPESVVLTEKTADSMVFVGAIPTTSVAPVHGDGLLSVSPGDTITGRYTDALDCDGAANVLYTTTAQVDCTAPAISNVQAVDVTGNSARVTWTTNEASTSVVHYGTAPPGASTTLSAALVTGHSVPLAGLSECSLYYYWVESADPAGNVAADDNGGLYRTFETGKNTVPNYPSLDTPIPIPDNNPAGATSTITVPDDNTVLDVNVTVNITHTYDGDIVLSLITPTGATITLSNRRGGGGDDFRTTVFDDEAATSISSGAAPFTGSFRPDSPLSAADGINAAGPWRLKVVDQAGSDSGTIDDWTLTLTFPAAQCGPHAVYSGHATVEDSCASGGAGAGDGVWDAGETVQFSVTARNDGSLGLTGVTATVTSTTPGVSILDGVASFPNLAPNTSGLSLAPHFTVHAPAGLACGATVDLQLVISSDQGSWPGSFTHTIGQITSPSGVALDESFSSGIPASWSTVDGGAGGGAAATWTTANPGGRSSASPMVAPTPIVDSDAASSGATQDEQLITRVIDLTGATTATLEFDEYFYYYSSGQNEKGDVDVRSSRTGGVWVNVLRHQGASTTNPKHTVVDITAQAAGVADAQVRFHYYDAANEWYWQVDNVKVGYTAPPGCEMTVCAPTGPPPVPDGRFGSAMRATRASTAGDTISVQWDVAACVAADYHLLFGPLAGVPSYAIAGAACDLGTSGGYLWSGVPGGGLWYIVVGDDGATVEGTWGTDSAGAHRAGVEPSGQCGMTARDNSGACP